MEEIIQVPISSFLNPLDESLTVDQKKKLTNIRKRSLLGHLDELKESIKNIGVKVPLLCRILPDGRYEIVCGQRRYLAVKELISEGVKIIELPVIVRQLSDADARILSTIDDVQHSAADVRDRGDQVKILMTELGDLKLVAQVLGVSEDTLDLWMSATSYNETIPEEQEKSTKIPDKIFYPGSNNGNNAKIFPKIPVQLPGKKIPTGASTAEVVTEPNTVDEQRSFPFYISFPQDIFDALWKYSKTQLGDQKDIIINYVTEAVRKDLKEKKLL